MTELSAAALAEMQAAHKAHAEHEAKDRERQRLIDGDPAAVKAAIKRWQQSLIDAAVVELKALREAADAAYAAYQLPVTKRLKKGL